MIPPTPQIPPVADPYSVLAVTPAASDDEIKQAYFTQVRAHPPESDPQAFKRIRAAYDRVRTPEKRLETDMLRLQPWAEPPVSTLPKVAPALNTTVAREDIIQAARAFTEINRHDFREDYREIKW